MAKLSAASQKRLDAAHPLLIKLFTACLADPACPAFTVLDSQRGREAQEKAFNAGNSKAHFGQSPHNWTPSIALDVAPLPIDWENLAAFKALGAFVEAKAAALKIPVGWGGRWKSFKDYPHFELTPWRDFAKKSKLFGV
jgi:peptidoglycan L-alanyl-D-glutamate endopeptidase CwlK